MNMPTLNEFKSFINGVGFPIVVCIILFYFNLQIAEKQNVILSVMNKTILENNKEILISRQTDIESGKLIAMLVSEYRKECRP